ncbi:hypothetical protein FQA39_LY05776 [Lamprigera yunnana]|nr:hypothetical protein FQA39_LY05776 [Lamprigera yunnana]
MDFNMGHYNKSTNKTCNGRRKKNAGSKGLKLFREKKRFENGAHSSASFTSRDAVVIHELEDRIDDHPLEICPETNDDFVAVNNITGTRIVDLAHLLDALKS